MSFSPRSLFFRQDLIANTAAKNELYTMNCCIILRRATFVVSITYRLVNLPPSILHACKKRLDCVIS